MGSVVLPSVNTWRQIIVFENGKYSHDGIRGVNEGLRGDSS